MSIFRRYRQEPDLNPRSAQFGPMVQIRQRLNPFWRRLIWIAIFIASVIYLLYLNGSGSLDITTTGSLLGIMFFCLGVYLIYQHFMLVLKIVAAAAILLIVLSVAGYFIEEVNLNRYCAQNNLQGYGCDVFKALYRNAD
jgi:hypothetical protein